MVIDDCFDLQVKNKKELFAALASRAAERLALAPEAALRALDNREKLGSTALGQGVALPHAQMSEASGPYVAMARLAKPIDFHAEDEAPVDIVLVVIWPPGDSAGLLAAMSGLCRALRSADTIKRIRRAPKCEDALELLRSATPQGGSS